MPGRKVIIDKGRCDGCGLCVTACHEGAIELVGGKAELVREDVCDGLGDCLPACPQGAISFSDPEPPVSGIGLMAGPGHAECLMAEPSHQWPIQLALVPVQSVFFRDTVVIAADCTAFATDGFRERFVGRDPVIIGCPKLDDRARFDKLVAIFRSNPVTRVRVIRMEVPCCRAIADLTRAAAEMSGRHIEVTETVVSRSGSVVELREPRL